MRNREIESALDCLVIAMCRDYARRALAIEEKSVSKRTDTEYRYLNFMILEAATEIVGRELANTYINEIGNKTGYAKSAVDGISEVHYKNTKALVRDNIARKLHLSD